MIKEIKEIKIKEIEAEIARLEESIKETGQDDVQLKNLEEQIILIQAATTLEELGLSFSQAIQILEKNNIPLILREEDKKITQREGSFEGIEDFILVHETRFRPTQNKIKSPREAHGKKTFTITLDGKKYNYEAPYMRNTVHFAVNNEVNTDHGYLNCDNCQYAVLIPMQDIIEEHEIKGKATDMYTVKGGPKLPKSSYILCPEGEGEELKKDNPGVTIVECEGESVRGYPQAFLSTIGYRQSATNAQDFSDDRDSSRFVEIMKKNGIELVVHFYSKENDEETALLLFEREISVYKIIKENGLIQSESDLSRIIEQLTSAGIIENNWNSMSQEQKEYFLKRMEEEGLDFTTIIEEGMETGKWSKGVFIQTALNSALVEEKVQPRIEQMKADLKSWQEACKARRKTNEYYYRRNL